MSDCIMFACIFWCGILFGNFEGDQATIKDCATKGEAKMLGGARVSCNVIMELK